MRSQRELREPATSEAAMSVIPRTHGQNQATTYVIAEIDVLDGEAFKEYAPQVQPTFEPFGGRYIIRGGNALALTGSAPNRIVVIAFDNMERARSWYDSPHYAALKPLRDKAGTARIFMIEGYLP